MINSNCNFKNRYEINGYTFELHRMYKLLGVEVSKNAYTIETDKEYFKLKICYKCKHLLPFERFYDNKSPCKKCHVLAVKKWRKENPDKDRLHKRRSNQNWRNKKKATP